VAHPRTWGRVYAHRVRTLLCMDDPPCDQVIAAGALRKLVGMLWCVAVASARWAVVAGRGAAWGGRHSPAPHISDACSCRLWLSLHPHSAGDASEELKLEVRGVCGLCLDPSCAMPSKHAEPAPLAC
jgi:hypothetical protein